MYEKSTNTSKTTKKQIFYLMDSKINIKIHEITTLQYICFIPLHTLNLYIINISKLEKKKLFNKKNMNYLLAFFFPPEITVDIFNAR